jgi:hypothetical protein
MWILDRVLAFLFLTKYDDLTCSICAKKVASRAVLASP